MKKEESKTCKIVGHTSDMDIKKVEDFLYDISWHREIGFETKEECQFLIDALQKYYGYKTTKSYDNRRNAPFIMLNGKDKKYELTIDITIAFYPDGDPWNDYAYCELLKP